MQEISNNFHTVKMKKSIKFLGNNHLLQEVRKSDEKQCTHL